MRYIYRDVARDSNGIILRSATVNVYLAGTTTAATVYTSSTSTTGVNSVTTDATDGSFTFYVDAFDYGSYQKFKFVLSKPSLSDDTFTADEVSVDEVVTGTYTISTAKTISNPVNVPKGVIWAKSGTGSITINAPFDSGLYQIFSGFTTGVTFGSGSAKEIFPEWWGAKSDNSTDCYASIASAILSIATSGGIVKFHTGTYLSNTRGIIITDNVNFKGTGSSSILKANSSAVGHFIAVRGQYVTIDSMQLDGNGAIVPGAYPTGGSTLELDGNGFTTQYVTIQNCVFKKNRFATIGGWNAHNINFINNVIVDAEDSAIAFVEGSSKLNIHRNTILDGGKFGISLDNADAVTYPDYVNTVNITENYIHITSANSNDAMDIQNCRGVNVTHNLILMDGGSASGIKVHTTAKDINVSENVLRFSANSASNTGIELNGNFAGTKLEAVNVSNNVLTPVATSTGLGTGILAYARNARLYNNLIHELNVGIQIQALANALEFHIESNSVKSCAVININISGSTGTLSTVYLSDNSVSGGGTYDYVIDSDYRVHLSNNPLNAASGSVAVNTVLDAPSGDIGDANYTYTSGVKPRILTFATTLTGNKTITLQTTGSVYGETVRVIRTGLGAYTLDVGGLKSIPNSTAAFVDVTFNGSAWVLSGYGTL